MVAGHAEEAADVLEVVVKLQPKDLVAKQMLESLLPPEESTDKPEATPAAAPPPATAAEETKPDPNAPTQTWLETGRQRKGRGRSRWTSPRFQVCLESDERRNAGNRPVRELDDPR